MVIGSVGMTGRYRWTYYKRGSTWFGKVQDPGGLEFTPYLTARSEKKIRRKIARLIKKQRAEDFLRESTTRHS